MEMISKRKWNWAGRVAITIGKPALRSGRPEDTQGTEEDQGRDGGTT